MVGTKQGSNEGYLLGLFEPCTPSESQPAILSEMSIFIPSMPVRPAGGTATDQVSQPNHGEHYRHWCEGNPRAKSPGKPSLRTTLHPYAPRKFLVETVIRNRIYDAQYWKEHCFALTGE